MTSTGPSGSHANRPQKPLAVPIHVHFPTHAVRSRRSLWGLSIPRIVRVTVAVLRTCENIVTRERARQERDCADGTSNEQVRASPFFFASWSTFSTCKPLVTLRARRTRTSP